MRGVGSGERGNYAGSWEIMQGVQASFLVSHRNGHKPYSVDFAKTILILVDNQKGIRWVN